jgi:hypothetical protein
MISYGQILFNVAQCLKDTAGVKRVENYQELSEGVADLPLIQVYFESAETDSAADDVSYTTFGGVIRQTRMTIIIDSFGRQRSNLSEDSEAQVMLLDALDNQLIDHTANNQFFGLTAIKQAKWSHQMVLHVRGDQQINYAGLRTTLTITIF